MKRNNFLIAFLLFLLLYSCDKSKIYEQYQSIPNAVWNNNEPLTFEMEVKDTTEVCNLLINIRCSEDYPYRNLYMFMKTTRPDGTRSIDTLEFYLLDQKGKPLGDCSGDVCNNKFMIDHDFKFPQPGTYGFELKQAMRTDNGQLTHVLDVGMRLERTTSKSK